MTPRALAIVAAILLTLMAACAGPRLPLHPPLGVPDTVKVRVGSRVVSTPLDDYIRGTIIAEISPTGETPAVVARLFEVQAVLARSYAAAHVGRHRAEGFDLCDTTHCQLYDPQRLRTSRFAQAADAAARATRGLVLSYGGRPAEGVFHADCGGATSDASTVWGAPVPYLIARKDDLPPGTHRSWTFEADAAALGDALNRDARTAIGARLLSITPGPRDAGGRPRTVTLEGAERRVVRADDLRAVLTGAFGARAMQSTNFTATLRQATWVFTGAGFGHGVGLCQAGARARARQGATLAEIIDAYFSGARLVRVRQN